MEVIENEALYLMYDILENINNNFYNKEYICRINDNINFIINKEKNNNENLDIFLIKITCILHPLYLLKIENRFNFIGNILYNN